MTDKNLYHDTTRLHSYLSQETERGSVNIHILDINIGKVASEIFRSDDTRHQIMSLCDAWGRRDRVDYAFLERLKHSPSDIGPLRAGIFSSKAMQDDVFARTGKLALLMQARSDAPRVLSLYRSAHQRLNNLHRISPEYRDQEIAAIAQDVVDADAARDARLVEQNDALRSWEQEHAPAPQADKGRGQDAAVPQSQSEETKWWRIPRAQRNIDGVPRPSYELPTQQREQVSDEEMERRRWASLTPFERQLEQAKALEQEGQIPERDETRGRR